MIKLVLFTLVVAKALLRTDIPDLHRLLIWISIFTLFSELLLCFSLVSSRFLTAEPCDIWCHISAQIRPVSVNQFLVVSVHQVSE